MCVQPGQFYTATAAEKSLELPESPPRMLITTFEHRNSSYQLGNAQREPPEGVSGTV